MKHLAISALVLLGLTGFSVQASENTLRDRESCNGQVYLSGQWISGNCNDVYCSAWVPASTVSVNGNCPSGARVSAIGMTRSEYFSETCRSGFLGFWDYGTQISLQGQCSDGRTFRGNISISSSYVTGSCTPNGPFSIRTNGSFENFTGTCE
jgi:hypothetical protein